MGDFIKQTITPDIVQLILTSDLNSSAAKLSGQDYNIQSLCEILNARPVEIRDYIQDNFNPNGLQDFTREIHKFGIM